MVDKVTADQLKTLDALAEAAQGWNGIDNPADSHTVTITFDSHEQARKFARNLGHLLWLAWAISEVKKINVADYLDGEA